MLQVGIHNRIKLGPRTAIQDNGSVLLHFIKSDGLDEFDSLMSEDVTVAEEATVYINSIYMTNYKGEDKNYSELSDDIKKLSKYYKDILAIYLTQDKINEYFNTHEILTGLGLEKDNFKTRMVQESFIKEVYDAFAKAFMTAFHNEDFLNSDETFRVKFIRKSADKHFPTLPYNPIAGEWIEPADATPSKLFYTDAEKKKDMDNPNPSDSDKPNQTETKNADSMFGGDDSIKEVFPDTDQPELGE